MKRLAVLTILLFLSVPMYAQITAGTWLNLSSLGSASDSIRGNPVRGIVSDPTGNVWWGTAMGLYRQASNTTQEQYLYEDSAFTQKNRNNILSIAALADSTIYTGSPIGLTRHDTLSFTVDSLITTALPDSVVWMLEPDSAGAAQVWGAGGDLLWIWDDTVDVVYSADSGLIGNVVYDLAIDSTGSVWIATNNGVSRIIGGYWIDYTTTNSSLNSTANYSIAVSGSDSSIWFGSSEGLVQFDGDSTWTDHTDSLSSPRVRDIIYSATDTTFWIATDSGLTGYMVSAAFPYSWWTRLYPGNTSDNLPEYNLFSVHADSGGRVWVGHSTGVTRFVQN